jgi:hypothetical protein
VALWCVCVRDRLIVFKWEATSNCREHLLKEHGINVNSNQAGNDEFDSYINGPDIIFENTDSVISWVLGPDNQWPAVRQQALDLLSIPATLTELERVFSQAKLTITPTGNKLSAETIEMLELLRYWWVSDIISQRRGEEGHIERDNQ